ncbi:MAG TPA: DUF3011 domain-containing protein [Vicinamibacterales bacterium]|jgi:hypothetical protein|nr:DUF3011 domain-containing protein [Vicinamibacterales bacterium]
MPIERAALVQGEIRLTKTTWSCFQAAGLCVLLLTSAARAHASDADTLEQAPATAAQPTQAPAPTPGQPTAAGGQAANLLACSSQLGQRIQCTVDTSGGVALVRSRGAAPCLYGDTWGIEPAGIWVADGCSGVFVVGGVVQVPTQTTEVKQNAPSYVPMAGFLLADTDKGQIYFRLFTYARYLNQRNIDPTYEDAFGNTKSVQRRQDMQLQKFFAPFSGWFLDPRMRYYLYVWSSNPSQGDPAQVVGAGNISWTWNRFITAGFGITSLPSTRSTEGQFPFWLGVDDRLIADEFFRGSYTSGVWLKGELENNMKYHVMLANNLSTLGVSAAQLDNQFNTQSYALQWLPTTGEFGFFGTFGDYDYHQKVATRVGGHYTRSTEEKQTQPGTEGIENSQIRLTDGSVIFTPDLFGSGVSVNQVDYQMMSIDAGVKYKGMSVEGEYYRRWLSNYVGANTSGIPNISDSGYQMQTSAMAVPQVLQYYVSWSQIFGDYGNPSEWRLGQNWYFLKQRGIRVNGEFIHVNKSPVGYTAYPMPVGANGNIFHLNFELNF